MISCCIDAGYVVSVLTFNQHLTLMENTTYTFVFKNEITFGLNLALSFSAYEVADNMILLLKSLRNVIYHLHKVVKQKKKVCQTQTLWYTGSTKKIDLIVVSCSLLLNFF